MDKDKQMEFLFEEGGMADDGLDRDPVSGNEVPSGSMSEEVRDDIPAQLSEGEYVVPADVVRYYGVKYFEDLREEAKEGLGEMERDGRIGGEPVDVEGDDIELTPEEMSELESIMGMAVGGYVDQANGNNSVSGVSSYNPLAQQALYNQPRGFQAGGDVPATTQVQPDFSQYGPGFSFMGSMPGQTMSTIEPSQNVTLYGPNGEVVNLILPAQQDLYDDLISQGYSTQPVAQTQDVQTSDSDGVDAFQAQRDLNRTLDTRGGTFTTDELGRVESDPISYANSVLEQETIDPRYGSAVGVLGGPIAGLAAGVGFSAGQLDNIAKARAARNIAAARGLDTTDLDARIDGLLENAPLSVRMLESMGFGSGRRYEEEMDQQLARRGDRSFSAPSWMTDANTASIASRNAENKLRQLTGAAAAYAEDQIQRGYTGSSVNDIAVGNISGDGQVAGVVAREDGTVVRDENRTVFRDEDGRTYVKTGLFGQNRQYKPVEGVSQNPQASQSSTSSEGDSNTPGTQGSQGYTGLKDMLDGGGPGQDAAGNENDGGCFLTTAVVDLRGESDDGPTLSILRNFRDTYLANKEGEVQRYYEVAPKIVAAIPKDHNVWIWVGNRIDKSVDYIKQGKKYLAYRTYKRMVEKLERDWLMEK